MIEAVLSRTILCANVGKTRAWEVEEGIISFAGPMGRTDSTTAEADAVMQSIFGVRNLDFACLGFQSPRFNVSYLPSSLEITPSYMEGSSNDGIEHYLMTPVRAE